MRPFGNPCRASQRAPQPPAPPVFRYLDAIAAWGICHPKGHSIATLNQIGHAGKPPSAKLHDGVTGLSTG